MGDPKATEGANGMATGITPTCTEIGIENAVAYPARGDARSVEIQDHLHAITDPTQSLTDRFAGDPRAFVTGDQILYDIEGD